MAILVMIFVHIKHDGNAMMGHDAKVLIVNSNNEQLAINNHKPPIWEW